MTRATASALMRATRRTLIGPVCAAYLLLVLPRLCTAGSVSDAPPPQDSLRQFGLLFDVQAAPHYSSPSSYADGGYTVSLGFGLNFSPVFQMTIQIYTGREMIPRGTAKPVDGWLPVGGASLEGTFFFATGTPVRPYAAAGYGLYTISGGDGYNGGGLSLEAGAEWDFSRFVSLRFGGKYDVIRYHDPTGEASQAVGFQPFTLRAAGAEVRMAFYPDLLP